MLADHPSSPCLFLALSEALWQVRCILTGYGRDYEPVVNLEGEAMTNLEFCTSRRKAERPAFINVLKAIPEEKSAYRPDPKARTAAELAHVLAVEEAALVSLARNGVVEWKDTAPPGRIEESVAAFERASSELNALMESMDDAAWERKVQFRMGEGGVWEDSLAQMVWGFLFDEIHHRGQLSTYLRPMGGKVPSIYGPSADDPGQ
jgi:uncharacterized damage-inducible protein DinB